ncbi:MAG: hypothetical protein WA897_02800 [Moheibacter sp.]
MKNIFRILIFVLVCNSGFGQELIPVDSIRLKTDGEITDFGTDDFNNIYLIRNSTELNKIDFRTKKRKNFSNRNILEELNTQNVLQLSLKSGFFNLLILDNQLNPIQDPIPLNSTADFSPTLTAPVDNNFLWAYDPVAQRLLLWNYREKKIVGQSMILNNSSAAEYFTKLIYCSNKIYLAGHGRILKFEEFANLEKVIPIGEYEQLFVIENYIFYSKDGEIYSLNQKTNLSDRIVKTDGFDFFSLNKSYLFVLKDKVVYLYDSQNLY